MATVNPARVGRIGGRVRGLRAGDRADVVRFRVEDGRIQVLETFLSGERVLRATIVGVMRRTVLAFVILSLGGCSRPNPAMQFDKLTEDFLYGSLALSPVSATATGYHLHNGVPLDELVDDYSAGGLDQQRTFYKDFQLRIAALDVTTLDKEQHVDLDIMKNNIESGAAGAGYHPELQTQSHGVRRTGGKRSVHALHAQLRAHRKALRADHQAPGENPRAIRSGQGQPGGCAGSLESRGAGGE